LRNICGRHFNIKITGEERGRVMMRRWANPRKDKRMQKKVGERNMSITLIYIVNQNILNSKFIITSNFSSFSASNGQAITSCLAKLGVWWEVARKERGRHMVMQFRTQPDSHRNKQNETETERDKGERMILAE
jgi:hypothetical protein